MKVEIEVALAIERALANSTQLWQNLEKAEVIGKRISVNAANIKAPAVGGASGSNAASTAAINQLNAAIARQRATAAVATQAQQGLNSAIGASTAAALAAASATNSLIQATQRHAAAAAQAQTATQSATATNNNLLGSVVQLAAGYVTLRGAWAFTADSVRQQIAIENLTNTLTATSGSAKQAASDLAFLRSESNRIGINFLESAQGFVKFDVAVKGAGLSGQFARQTFTALSEASRRLGLDSQQQASVFLALEQMLSKGTVSAQELRLQLGNALPGAFQTAARAMGVTTAELSKLVETGNLAAADFLPKFINQLQKELPATAETLASTSAELNRLGNAWQEFKAKLGANVPVQSAIGFASGAVDIASAMVDNRSPAEIKATRNPTNVRRGQIANMLTQGDSSLFAGADAEDINIWMRIEEQARKKAAEAQTRRQTEADRIANSDKWDETDLQKADKFWKLYRQLASDALTDEANRRDDIARRYDDIISKIRENKEAFSQPLVDTLVEQARQAQTAQLNQFDQSREEERNKKITAELTKQREEAEAIKDLQLRLIPDEEEQKIARINREFDEIRNKLLLFELGNPSSIGGDWESQLDAARQRAISGVRTQKSPVGFLGDNFTELNNQRQNLIRSLATEDDVNEFRNKSQQIQEIYQAMLLKLKSDNASFTESFSFGVQEMLEAYGSFAERVAKVGASIADSIERNLTDSITAAVINFDDAGEAFRRMGEQIYQELVRIAVQELIVKQAVQGISSLVGLGASFGSAAGGYGVAGSGAPNINSFAGHGGMVVGREGMTTQFFPRLHSGSGPIGDETIVMARRDEAVLTPEQMKQVAGMRSSQPLQIITLFDRNVFDQMRAANPNAVVSEISSNKQVIKQLLQ